MHHDYPNRRHSECPDVHLGLCAGCERLYDRDRLRDSVSPSVDTVIDAGQSSDALHGSPDPGGALGSVLAPIGDGDIPGATGEVDKAERLQTAKAALTDAERQKRRRNKDPEAYRAWNKARMRRIRGSPKPE